MSSTLRPSPLPPDRALAALRAELDHLDDALHDLVMRRAEVVEQVGSLGVKGRVPMRPGREASILRRLLARHAGRLPAEGVVRIWRELICAHTALQRPLLIAVCVPDVAAGAGSDWPAVAREHFGALTPLRPCADPAAALRDVASGQASAAVLPFPGPGVAPWWAGLDLALHVVARLPFWAPRPEGAPTAAALVVSAAPPDPSGLDRTLVALDGAALAGARALAAGLVELDGFVAADDPGLPAGARVLGAYAVPLGASE